MMIESTLPQGSSQRLLQDEVFEFQFKRRLTQSSIALLVVSFGIIAICSPIRSLGELITESLLAVLLITTTYTDCRYRMIFNLTTYSVLLLGFALAMLTTLQAAHDSTGPMSWATGVVRYLFSVTAVGLMMLIPYRLSGGGAGDVKLAMAIAGLTGFAAAWWSIAIGYIVAFAMVVLISVATQLVRISSQGITLHTRQLLSLQAFDWLQAKEQCVSRPIPLAGFFALGVIITRSWGLAA